MSRYRTLWATRIVLWAYKAACRLGGGNFDGLMGLSLTRSAVDALRKTGWDVVRFDQATEPGERPIVTERWPT